MRSFTPRPVPSHVAVGVAACRHPAIRDQEDSPVTCSPRFVAKALRRLAAVAVLALTPDAVFAGYDIYEKDDQKLEIGMRLQPRMEYSRTAASGGGTEWLRD